MWVPPSRHLLPVLACALLALPLLPGRAAAASCTSAISGPNDPDYAPSERTGNGSYNVEQWYLYDCLPQSAPLATDDEGAAGMSVNKAWAQYGYGSDQVLVAYLEGGVNWRRPDTAPDLRTRAFLNTGELPKPIRNGKPCSAYDCDGNGVVNVDDYASDPRIKKPLLHVATAGGITSEDLIRVFSDRKDADHNGYVDDISGWNSFRETNDPQTDQSIYNHANSQSVLAVGTANDGFGRAGICPKCRLLSVKIGDEAIDRADRTAAGILYAVDAGAKVVIAVSVSLGTGPALQSAVEYAYRHGTTVVMASNDFESTDHTEGMRLPHVWPGNGVVADLTNRQDKSLPVDATTRTFRSRSSLTSYGAHALFSAAAKDGSTSESTPSNGGVAAMVYSAGFAVGHPLAADEVKQVVRATASPIDVTPASIAGRPFPALRGWDLQYGYGRPNVFKAVQAVHAGRVPPMAVIQSPDWYSPYDPTRQRSFRVTADVAARRASSYRWALEFAPGVQPTDSQFRRVASGSGTGPKSVTGTVDLTRVPRAFWSGAYALTADRLSSERFTATVRLRVTDNRGLMGEDRRAVEVRHDSDELPGFPRYVGAGDTSPTLADVEGRGQLDVILASEGTVRVLRRDGNEAPGFPVHTGPAPAWDPAFAGNHLSSRGFRESTGAEDPISNTLAVGDLDHTGELDIVATTVNGRVWAWDGAGHVKRGFPVQTDRRFARQQVPVPNTPYIRNRSAGAFSSPVLVDLDGDRRLEVVQAGFDGRIYAWRSDGRTQPGFPVETQNPSTAQPPGFVYARDFKVATTPAVADVDGDRIPDLVVALADTSFPTSSNATVVRGYLTAFHGQGNRFPKGALVSGYPVAIPAAAQGYGTAQDFITEGVQTPVTMDLPTGPVAVVNAGLFTQMRVDLRRALVTPMTPAAFSAESPLQTATAMVHFTSSASAGHLVPGATTPQVAQGGSATSDVATGVVATPGLGIKVRSGVSAYDVVTGSPLPGFAIAKPQQGLPILSAPVLADLTGDRRNDIALDGDSAAIVGYDAVTGATLTGFPKWTGGFGLWTPAVGDFAGDGHTVLLAQTREGLLHAWRTPGLLGGEDAWHWHQDDRNTGHLGTDTRPPAAVQDVRMSGRTVTWRASGDDWQIGHATSYLVLTSDRPITQSARSRARVLARTTSSTVTVTGAQAYVAVQAIDDASNLSPLPVGVTSPPPSSGSAQPPSTLPATGGDPGAAALATVLIAGALLIRRLRARACHAMLCPSE